MNYFNFYIIPLTALVPVVMSYIWYSHSVLGRALEQKSGITLDSSSQLKLIRTITLSYLFGFLVAYLLSFATVHQLSVLQLFFMDPAMDDATSEISQFTAEYMERYGTRHRSFGHGVVHGLENGFLLSLAIIGLPGLIENRSWKYIFIHVGFWTVCFGIMAGILCQFL